MKKFLRAFGQDYVYSRNKFGRNVKNVYGFLQVTIPQYCAYFTDKRRNATIESTKAKACKPNEDKCNEMY